MSMESITIVGIAIQTVLFLIGGYALIIRNDESNKILARRVESIEEEMKAMAKVVTQIAVQTVRIDHIHERINLLDKRVDDLRHLDGLVLPKGMVAPS